MFNGCGAETFLPLWSSFAPSSAEALLLFAEVVTRPALLAGVVALVLTASTTTATVRPTIAMTAITRSVRTSW